MTDPPAVDPPGPGWRETESSRATALDVGPVEVTVATVVFEDADLRDRVAAATGLDYPWRFAFAGRVDVPGSASSRALGRLVTDRARSGFADRLRERGFTAVERAGTRTLDGTEATRYVARVAVEAVTVGAEGWLAVRPEAARERSFRLAGGAYPRSVEGAPDEETGTALADLFDPGTFRADAVAFLGR